MSLNNALKEDFQVMLKLFFRLLRNVERFGVISSNFSMHVVGWET